MVEEEVNVQPTRPVIDDQTDTTDGDDSVTDVVVADDEKTGLESLSLQTWIILGICLVVVSLGSYIFYKCWVTCRAKNKIKSQLTGDREAVPAPYDVDQPPKQVQVGIVSHKKSKSQRN